MLDYPVWNYLIFWFGCIMFGVGFVLQFIKDRKYVDLAIIMVIFGFFILFAGSGFFAEECVGPPPGNLFR